MKSKIHILQLVNGFAIGGAETKLLDLIRRLDKKKYKVFVAGVGQGGPLQSEFEKAADGLVVFEKKSAFDFSLIFKVANYIKRNKIDLVQTTLLYADLIGPMAAKLAGVKHVISWETVSHGENDPLRTKTRHRFGYRLSMKMVSRIIAVSKETQISIILNRKINPKKVKLIYYGVDTDLFNSSENGRVSKRAEFGIREDDIVISAVARLEEVKGHKYLIEATKDLIKDFPALKIVFVGDGTLRGKLENQVENLSLSPHYRFLGFRKDVVNLLKMSDIFVLPSLSEGLPNVLLEAMACSKPVVSTNVGGIPEIISTGKTGYLVSPEDSNLLRKAIRKLVENPDYQKKIGAKGRQLVENNFSLNKMVQDFEYLYDSF